MKLHMETYLNKHELLKRKKTYTPFYHSLHILDVNPEVICCYQKQFKLYIFSNFLHDKLHMCASDTDLHILLCTEQLDIF